MNEFSGRIDTINLQLNGELYRTNQTKVAIVNDKWDKFVSFEEYGKFTEKWHGGAF